MAYWVKPRVLTHKSWGLFGSSDVAVDKKFLKESPSRFLESDAFKLLQKALLEKDQAPVGSVKTGKKSFVEALSWRLVNQVHGVKVAAYPLENLNDAWPEADALATAERGVALAVLTADCLPILFEDPINGVIGAAHAGWRGLASGVVEETISQMRVLGAGKKIRVAAGPSICLECYEVQEDFVEALLTLRPKWDSVIRVERSLEGERKYHFNLTQAAQLVFNDLGIPYSETWVGQGYCTACHAKFYSWRRACQLESWSEPLNVSQKETSEGRVLRQISFICLR